MFTWTSSPFRILVALLGATILVACDGYTSQVGRSNAGSILRPPTQISVAQDSVVIVGPSGFCIDRSGSRPNADNAFVLLGTCRSVARNAALAEPAQPGILTAAVESGVSGRSLPSRVSISRYFKTPAGRAALSASGRAETVRTQDIRVLDDIVLVHAIDKSADDLLSGNTWRAIFSVNGRIISATLRDLASDPISQDDGFMLLKTFATRIKAASPGSAG